MPPEIRRLALQYMNRPETVAISRGTVAAPTVTQVYYRALESQKLDVLCRILDAEEVERGILFCRTKKAPPSWPRPCRRAATAPTRCTAT